MRIRNIVKLMMITIIELITLSISSTYAATVESNQYKFTKIDRKKLCTRNISKYKSR